jgi:hypothetical protein
MRRLLLFFVCCFPPAIDAAEPVRVSLEEADARLRSAYYLAKESNDANLVERVLAVRDSVRTALERKDLAAAERLIRDAEELAGLDPGGKTMLGLPVARVAPDRRKQLDRLRDRLAAAMAKEDRVSIPAVIGEIAKLLGDQAGVPDVRRHGDTEEPSPVKPGDVADLFLKLVQTNTRQDKSLTSGVPAADSLPRSYAAVVLGCLTIRPIVQEHRKDKLETIDRLVHGCCKAMLALQLDTGFFKFPDLRGKHLRYGEAIEKIVEQNPDAVKDGWLVVPDPEGGNQADTAECGIALLRAGAEYKNTDWTKAGRKAADWALRQPNVPNFHYNAYSLSLICEVYRVTGDKAYLDSVQKKHAIGIASGQSPNGRCVHPECARTASHVVLLRAFHDLEEVLPAGKERENVAATARLAVKALVEEADKLGAPVTSYTVQELSRHLRLHTDAEPRVRAVLEKAASATFRRSKQGNAAIASVSLPELAAASRVWTK